MVSPKRVPMAFSIAVLVATVAAALIAWMTLVEPSSSETTPPKPSWSTRSE